MLPAPTPAAPYLYVSQMAVGAHADGVSYLGREICGTSSLSTYDSLEDLAARPAVAEGALIVDKRPIAENDAAVRAVISGPMLKLDLPPCTVDNWPATTYASVDEALASNPRGFAYVSADVYAEYWRRLGARIGRKVNGAIVWEES